jgi:hypothetical protein
MIVLVASGLSRPGGVLPWLQSRNRGTTPP